MFDRLKPRSYFTLIKYDKNGKILWEERINNLVVNQGLEYVAKLFNGVSTDPFKYIAIGTDSTSEAVGQTALVAEYERVLADVVYESDYKAKLTATYVFTGSVTIKEAGVFDDASAGHMYARKTFADKSFTSGESLGIIWTIEFSRS